MYIIQNIYEQSIVAIAIHMTTILYMLTVFMLDELSVQFENYPSWSMYPMQ